MKKSWQDSLAQRLTQSERLALVGVGSDLRGDDAAGVRVVQVLQALCSQQERCLLCSAGIAPENVTGLLRRFRPDALLLIDAVQMGLPPGHICLLDWRKAEGSSFSTHTLPLKLFAEYLTLELGCEPLLLGIQPQQLMWDAPLSPAVRDSVRQVVQVLRGIITARHLAQAGAE